MLMCPECGSDRLIRFGTKFARDTQSMKRRMVQQYQCKNCGRITIKPQANESGKGGSFISIGSRNPNGI